MAFASAALDAHQKAGREIGVGIMFSRGLFSWRVYICMHILLHITIFPIVLGGAYVTQLAVRTVSIALGWCGCGDGRSGSWRPFREQFLVRIRIFST
jgi:hypothetical protein